MPQRSVRNIALLDSDWKFHVGDIPAPVPNKHISAYMANKAGWAAGAARADFDDSDWRSVDLPHDWSVEGAFDPANHVDAGFLPRGIGWYRRHFRLEETDRGKYLALQFEGVATHCTVAVNGHILQRNFCGYTPFTLEMTDIANFGDELNVVAVRVDATPMEGWWYEGAGIYRDVRLIKTSPLHIATNGVFVCPRKRPDGGWDTNIETNLVNGYYEPKASQVRWSISNDTGELIAEGNTGGTVPARGSLVLHEKIEINKPELWSLENPRLYQLKTTVTIDAVAVDDDVARFGYRTVRFDPDHGFFLNDQPVKLKGTCNHQDHAGVGVAVPDSIQEFRVCRLLEMGTNAYRCAHNPPAPSLLDACDRLGMLVMDENRNFGSSPGHLEQLRTMVRRDRNHPSIILWSICNEETIQGTPAGANIARTMQQVVKELDPSRPVTAAVSGGILNETGIGGVIEVMGINYQLPLHDQYHAKHPKVPLIASETHCVLSTRGTYETNDREYTFASYDSDLATWGASSRETLGYVLSRPFVAGFFAWTGFDYRGEPTPHAWPCVNSHWGIMDTCGFPKDAFYLHKAWLTTERFVYLLPHWNWRGKEGMSIKVLAYTNCGWAELFLNDKSLGGRPVDPSHQATWDVPYSPGSLRVIARETEGTPVLAAADVETTGPPAKLGLKIDPSFGARTIPADGRFAIPITMFAMDSENRRVPTASDLVTLSVKGHARILGVGNGNPVCQEPDKASARSLFRGLAQVILQTTREAGEIELTASAPGLASVALRLRSTPTQFEPTIPAPKVRYPVSNWRMSHITAARPDPNAGTMDQDMNSWDRIDPASGPQEAWSRSSGFATYRAICKVPKILRSTGGRIVFREIIGAAEIFLDGVAVAERSDTAGGEMSTPFAAGAEQLSILVMIHCAQQRGGISKLVELLPH